ncbi:MAG TPA: adenylate/guanylate cyclase domain-containing protein [Burkholderiales bacterium]|nr:adenylate/guanylate cyclase domain-containing protein [Burkholderiales bacterium]
MQDFGTLSMAEIIRLQSELQQELTRRFQRYAALAFSDIVGSTEYFARVGDAAGRQLQQLHLDLVGECLTRHPGRLVDTAGDGAFLTFETADGAIGALMELHTAVSRANAARSREHQLRLRIGAHWGPVLTDGVAVSGDAVNLCARVAGSAEPGEIRLTREMFRESSAAHRLKCRPLGAAELKGVARQVELFVLDWRDRELFPTHIRIEETAEVRRLPDQDIISFGRLREHEGAAANDVVLTLEDPQRALQISRWQFELRRFPDGFRLRPLSERQTEVDGAAVPKNGEVAVKAGSKVRVARVLTVTLLSPASDLPGASALVTRVVE